MASHLIIGSEFGECTGGLKRTEVVGAVGCCSI